ncbi:MAG: hypothetical protein WAZ36_12460 [Sediminibacterium sp.]
MKFYFLFGTFLLFGDWQISQYLINSKIMFDVNDFAATKKNFYDLKKKSDSSINKYFNLEVNKISREVFDGANDKNKSIQIRFFINRKFEFIHNEDSSNGVFYFEAFSNKLKLEQVNAEESTDSFYINLDGKSLIMKSYKGQLPVTLKFLKIRNDFSSNK